jgi:hypothetical protein
LGPAGSSWEFNRTSRAPGKKLLNDCGIGSIHRAQYAMNPWLFAIIATIQRVSNHGKVAAVDIWDFRP